MNCGFIEKDYSVEYKELPKEELEQLCSGNQYFSINSNNEYYIFVDNEIYTKENADKVIPLMVKVNKELLVKSR